MRVFDPDISALAVDFWASSGVPLTFPRSLEPAVFLVLPLAVVRLPSLRRRIAIRWLDQHGISHGLHTDVSDPHLHGYLIARGGAGIVFLNGTDPLDEQLFSLAHEIAHFLCDYWRPRVEALRVLGADISAVLDGIRPPTLEEQLAGLLRGAPLGTFSHVGRRSNRNPDNAAAALHLEDRADQLALELLAPLAEVTAALRRLIPSSDAQASRGVVGSVMREHFGLPEGVAALYARVVVSTLRSRQSFREWLSG